MKCTKKLIAIILAIITVLSLSVMPAYAAGSDHVGNFVDVPADAWYAKAVKWAVEKKITDGKTSTKFCPDDNVTFVETCAFLYRAYGKPSISNDEITRQMARLPSEVRVKIQSWAQKPVAWALWRGVAKTYELTATTDSTGKLIVPNEPLTRNYVITMLYRAHRIMGNDVSRGVLISPKYEDYADRNDANLVKGGDGPLAWKWAISRGIITGRSQTRLACNGKVKRCEVVTILYRCLVTDKYVSLALKQNGKRYVSGGKGPDVFDCSGLVYYVLTSTGLADKNYVGCSCQYQVASKYTKKVASSTESDPTSKLQYGDLIYYKRSANGGWDHVTIYLGKIDMSTVTDKNPTDTMAVFHAKGSDYGVMCSGFYREIGTYFSYWEAYRFDPYPDN